MVLVMVMVMLVMMVMMMVMMVMTMWCAYARLIHLSVAGLQQYSK